MLIPVRSYIPFFKSLRIIGDEKLHPVVLKHRDQFASELGFFLKTLRSNILSAEACIADPPDNVLELLSRKSWFVNLKPLCDFIEVSAEVEVDVDLLRDINETSELDPAFINQCALDEVEAGLDAALVLSELAFPGCIHTLDGALISPTHTTTTLGSKGGIYELLCHEDGPSWPELRHTSLIQTLEWAKKIGFGAQAFASTRLSKALASLTHIVGAFPQSHSVALFRAVQGLEAFYCDGVGDLRRQMSEKSAVWLGRWSDDRNIVGQLYDTRSKFVHGSAPIQYWKYHGDPWQENEKAMDEHEYATTFAMRLLVASLQKCVLNGITELNWTFSVEVNREPTNSAVR